MSGEAATQAFPTIVLIGGQLTLTDGSVVDSRQPVADEKTAGALQAALSGRAEWWSAVSSIVVPTLDDPEGGFAVVLGQRSMVRARLDGETRRSRLRKFLPGAVGGVSVILSGSEPPPGYRNLAHLCDLGPEDGFIAVHFDNPMPRWCFVDGNDYFLRLVVNRIGARVIIDTAGGLPACEARPAAGRWSRLTAAASASIDYCSPCACPYLVVVPDTARMRDRVGDLLAGRLDPFPRKAPEASEVPPYEPEVEQKLSNKQRYVTFDELEKITQAPFSPADFLRFPVVRAECSVSGLLREGQWGDGAGLEAARMLLLKRYDLKLGLWDLATNPVLRSTVLDSLPVQGVPEEAVQALAIVWKQAERKTEEATARWNTRRRAVREINATLLQVLASIGWSIYPPDSRFPLPPTEPLDRIQVPDRRLCLPLTIERLLGEPLVRLEIRVNQSSIHVVVKYLFYADIDVDAFIEKRREAFEAVGLPPASTKDRISAGVVLWTANVGWRDHDTDADWSNIAKAIADCTKQWVDLLADFVASCRELGHAKYDRSQLYD